MKAGHNATATDGHGCREPRNHVYVSNVRNEGKTPKTKIYKCQSSSDTASIQEQFITIVLAD